MKRLLLTFLTVAVSLMSYAKSEQLFLIAGSYAAASSEGIKVFMFNQENGHFKYISGIKGVENPSYLTVNRNGTRVYAVGENDKSTSTANAFRFNKANGTLTFLNQQPTQGAAPCNITLSPQQDYALTANYTGGSITLFPLTSEGTLQKGQVISFSGKGPFAGRQDQSHLHCVMFTPDNKLLLANDLGTDKIHVFPLNTKHKTGSTTPLLTTTAAYDLSLKPGSGPRHICFAPNGHFAYLITELSGEVVTISYRDGRLSPVQYIKADSLNAHGSADIHISPDGKFVYASNRLKGDGLAVFKVSPVDGKLTRVGYQTTGVHPRNFIISPNGRFVLVACRDTNNVIIYERDSVTGLLKDTGQTIQMTKPVCLKFVKPD